MEHAVEIAGDAGFRKHVTHEHEERHRDQRIPVQYREGGVVRHLERAFAPEQKGRNRADKTNDAEDTLPGHQQQHHCGKHEKGDEFRAHM